MHEPPRLDPVATIEIELLKLVRRLETLGRRSGLYSRVDRAGYLALRTLQLMGPSSVNVLAEALHLDASTVTRQINVLNGQGLVLRQPTGLDGRSSALALTTEGRRVMRSVERRRRHEIAKLTNDWSSEDRGRFGELLALLNVALGARRL